MGLTCRFVMCSPYDTRMLILILSDEFVERWNIQLWFPKPNKLKLAAESAKLIVCPVSSMTAVDVSNCTGVISPLNRIVLLAVDEFPLSKVKSNWSVRTPPGLSLYEFRGDVNSKDFSCMAKNTQNVY